MEKWQRNDIKIYAKIVNLIVVYFGNYLIYSMEMGKRSNFDGGGGSGGGGSGGGNGTTHDGVREIYWTAH